ncbi:MAG: flagellar biosynthesis protein FlhA [Firmicutes bacterium]|nr:flagellar biosynthesis protein FlhA [Bacillota bacterium]
MIFGVVAIVVFMVLPLPPMMLDFLHSFNITLSLMVLLIAMYTLEPLNFSVFPSLLLIITLLRLSLNIGGTRLILLHGYAGEVINTFGDFVVGGNYVVGIVIFLILVVIQFVVITSGAQRVAEVAARFTLDAMPGKQMSIDADLSAGVISQEAAQERRRKIEREADFYGAMDGAGKFIKGESIASIIIIIINIIGGFIVGVAQQGLQLVEAVQKFTLLTVGEGLVTQIPALLISTAMGIIVTRAASDSNLGEEATEQILAQPRLIMFISILLVLFGLVPGLPKIPFFLLAILSFLLYRKIDNEEKQKLAKAAAAAQVTPQQAKEKKRAEEGGEEPGEILPSLDLEPLEIEIGYSLVPLVDDKRGGDLLERILMVRKSCSRELGVAVPPVRIRDNIMLDPKAYRIKIFGEVMAENEIVMGRLLAMGGEEGDEFMDETLEGLETREPVFGLPALWIKEDDKEKAELLGYTVIDGSSIIATHLSEIIKTRASLLLGRQETQDLLSKIKEKYPALINELIPNVMTVGDVQKVLQNLLSERVPVKNLRLILEVLADYGSKTKDPYFLTEQVRTSLARTICKNFQTPDGTIPVITLGMDVENFIREALQKDRNQPLSTIEPAILKRFYDALMESIRKVSSMNLQPIILCSQAIRVYVKKLTEKVAPDVSVLSYNEILPDTTIHTVDVLTIGPSRMPGAKMDGSSISAAGLV